MFKVSNKDTRTAGKNTGWDKIALSANDDNNTIQTLDRVISYPYGDEVTRENRKNPIQTSHKFLIFHSGYK